MGCQASAPPAAPRAPAPKELAGDWRFDVNGRELAVAPRADGHLHYSLSGARVALLRPQGSTFMGDEVFWNCGTPVRVELRPRDGMLEYRKWNSATGNWFVPDRFRRLSPAESAARGRYVAMNPIWDALTAHHTVLLKGSWLMKMHRADEVVPRRQELPSSAAWKLSELQSAVEAGTVRIVALSYCWKDADHPDPEGEQLETLAALIERRLAYCFPDDTPVLEDLAVFWDYPCLFQKPRSGPEQEAFEKSLNTVNLWYAHSSTEVWLLTRVPKAASPYNERGWPVFERAVGSLVTPHDAFLDFGLLEGDVSKEDWPQVAFRCSAQRDPPLRPERLAELLATKTFRSGADFGKVLQIYERTYREVMSSTRSLEFTHLLNWGDREAEALAECLPDCPQLEELDLSFGGIGAAGAGALATAVAQCRSLRVVHMESNPLNDDGTVALFAGLTHCPALELLNLDETGIEDRGAQAIAEEMPRCRALRRLYLNYCFIDDQGAAALGPALSQCETLEKVEIMQNNISPQGKSSLLNAWHSAGKRPGFMVV